MRKQNSQKPFFTCSCRCHEYQWYDHTVFSLPTFIHFQSVSFENIAVHQDNILWSVIVGQGLVSNRKLRNAHRQTIIVILVAMVGAGEVSSYDILGFFDALFIKILVGQYFDFIRLEPLDQIFLLLFYNFFFLSQSAEALAMNSLSQPLCLGMASLSYSIERQQVIIQLSNSTYQTLVFST